MSRLREFGWRLRGLFGKDRLDRDLDAELQAHLEMLVEENVHRGMSLEEARLAARRSFGGLEQTKEAYRDQRGLPIMETFLQDLRFGFRMLRKNPGFTTVAVLTLALGIGANTAIFSVVNAVLLKPLPYQHSEELMTLWEAQRDVDKESASIPNFNDWVERNRSFSQMAGAWRTNVNLTGAGEPERLIARLVTPNFFSTLGVTPQLGRDFTFEDEKPDSPPAVVISQALWQRRFGGSGDVIGRQIALNGTSFTVIGVLPADFQFYTPADVFGPIRFVPERLRQAREEHGGFVVVARLKPGVTRVQAAAEMAGIEEALEREYPKTNSTNRALIEPLVEDLVGDIKPSLLVLVGAVGLVLLIACANVANLLLARASARQKEIAIRAALGATRGRVVRQLLTESAMLSLAGGALGLMLAQWVAGALYAAMPNSVPWVQSIRLDKTVMAFTTGISLLTGIVFGLVPAFAASKPNLNEVFAEGTRGSTGARGRTRSLLVVTEIALAIVLLVGAGLMLRSFQRLRGIDPGFKPENLLSMQLTLAPANYTDKSHTKPFYDELLRRIQTVPGVESASVSTSVPLGGATVTGFLLEGQSKINIPEMPLTVQSATGVDFLSTMKVALIEGRYLNEHDTDKTPLVAIIDERLGRDFFAGSDPIGKHILLDDGAVKFEIVGVVAHVKHLSFDADEQSKVKYQMYTAFNQIPDPWYARVGQSMQLVVRTNTAPQSLMPAVREQILQVDRDQPVYNVRTMDESIAGSISERRFAMLLLVVFASSALLLATVGIYGVMSYSVTQRTREIGIRIAMGASRRDVLRLVVSGSAALALAGVGIGLVAACALTRLMSSLLYGVTATDPVTFAVIPLVLMAVAVGACLAPARRALRVDPMVALRCE